MEKEDIRIQKVIMHILDTQTGQAIYSDTEMDAGPDFKDFLKGHIYRVLESDEKKKSRFQELSEAAGWIEQLNAENFVTISFYLANSLYGIMNSNIDIPAADLLLVLFEIESEKYLAILKMNYKRSYTHRELPGAGRNVDIAVQKATLPGSGAKLSEAAIVNLKNRDELYVLEKRYEINGVKTNYFSEIFLQCKTNRSEKDKLSIVQRTIQNVQQKYYADNSPKRQIETAQTMNRALAEDGEIDTKELIGQVLEGKEMQQEATELLERYGLGNSTIQPENENTRKKLYCQTLKTDTGIELKIPIQEFERDSIQFMDCEDGTMQMLIGNFGRVERR